MGTYTDFSVAGYTLINSKSAVISEVMTIFRESDKRVFKRRLVDENPLVWGDADSDSRNKLEIATEYACDTEAAIARLEVMGYTIERAQREYETGRRNEIEKHQQWTQDVSGRSWISEHIALLETLSFNVYLDALRHVIVMQLRPEPFDNALLHKAAQRSW